MDVFLTTPGTGRSGSNVVVNNRPQSGDTGADPERDYTPEILVCTRGPTGVGSTRRPPRPVSPRRPGQQEGGVVERRTFLSALTGSLLVAPRAEARQVGRVPRSGVPAITSSEICRFPSGLDEEGADEP